MATPGRRALGTKDANAPINTRSPTKSSSNTALLSTSAPRKGMSSYNVRPDPPHSGQKRSIDHVEDAERLDDEFVPTASQRTEILSDTASESNEQFKSSKASYDQDPSHRTNFTSFMASQNNDSQPLDQQFELQPEEMSQRSLDKLNAIPLPQNTSQLPPNRPSLFNEMSAGSVGLSAYLDFDIHESSQASDQAQPQQEPERQPQQEKLRTPSPPADDTESRKQLLTSAAAQLRTRLQLALFKVETNQTTCPFSRLRTPPQQKHWQHKRQRSSSPITSQIHPDFKTPRLASSSTAHTTSASLPPRLGLSAPVDNSASAASAQESLVYNARARATSQVLPPVQNLNNIPFPHIKPTAHSARWAKPEAGTDSDAQKDSTEQDLAAENDNNSSKSQTAKTTPSLDQNITFPSSPPLSRSNSSSSLPGSGPGSNDIPVPTSPTKHGREGDRLGILEAAEPPTQLSSPPASPAAGMDEGENGDTSYEQSEVERSQILSPAKGEAASGLMELLRSDPARSV